MENHLAAVNAMISERRSAPPEWDLILSASQKNNADEVLRLLREEGVPPSHSNVVGQTGLHIAALWGSVEAMEMLIDAGADANAQNRIAGTTPLICAVKGTFQSFKETHPRRLRCVQILLEAGADGSLRDTRGRDAFESVDDAIQEASMRDVGDIEEEMEEMRKALGSAVLFASPLAQCIDALDVKGVEDCLANDEVDGTDMAKGLIAAAQKFKLLVDEGSDDDGACYSLKDIIHGLLEASAEPNSHPLDSSNPSPLAEAPLHVICSSICSAYFQTPKLESIATHSSEEIIRDLLAHGAKVGSVTMALLPNAAHRGNVRSVDLLTRVVGVDPNFRGRQGMTGLILASRVGKVDVVKLMLEDESVDVSITDDAGKTAVDYATANGREDTVKLLLRRS